MIKNKYVPTNVNQEWHLIDTNYGDDAPDIEGLYLVITQNRDYEIAEYVHKGETLKELDKDEKSGLVTVQVALEDGFYSSRLCIGKRVKIRAIAWTRLFPSIYVFNAMCGKE